MTGAEDASKNGAPLGLGGTVESPYGVPCPHCTVVSASLRQFDAAGNYLTGKDIPVSVSSSGGVLSGSYSGNYEPGAGSIELSVTAIDGTGGSATGLSVPPTPVDNTRPIIVGAAAINPTQIEVRLSERVAARTTAADWIADGHRTLAAELRPSPSGGDRFVVTLDPPLESNERAWLTYYPGSWPNGPSASRGLDRVDLPVYNKTFQWVDLPPPVPTLATVSGDGPRQDAFYTSDDTPDLYFSGLEGGQRVWVYEDTDGNGEVGTADTLQGWGTTFSGETSLTITLASLGTTQRVIPILVRTADDWGNTLPLAHHTLALETANPAPVAGSVSHLPEPAAVGDTVTFTVGWSDPGDSVRAVICKTDAISAGACPGGAWAVGDLSTASPSTVSFQPTSSDLGTHAYYAFVCDSSGSCSNSIVAPLTVLEPNPAPVPALDSALLMDAEKLAHEVEIPVPEALGYLRLQPELGEFGARLSESEPQSFAGLYLSYEPVYQIVVLGATSPLAYQEHLPPALETVSDSILYREVQYRLADLELAAEQFRDSAPPVPFDSEVDVRSNRIAITAASEADAQTLSTASQLGHYSVPGEAFRVQAGNLAQPSAPQVYGGLTHSGGCIATLGYTVRHTSGQLGITAAGHIDCPPNPSISYAGQALPFQARDLEGNQDVQWHTTPRLEDLPRARDGVYDHNTPWYREINGRRLRQYMVVGEWVCKYGYKTEHTCGTIGSKTSAPYFVTNVKGTFVRVDSSRELCDIGDSGSPWYQGRTAFGTLSFYVPPFISGNSIRNCIFMPIEFINSLGLSLLTTR